MRIPNNDNNTNPYEAFVEYHHKGWANLIPLPHHKKSPVPTGYTGRNHTTPSYPDMQAWSEHPTPQNIALVLDPSTLGFDVDAYLKKLGHQTFMQLQADLGPLPKTIMSTSRNDGRKSGIRLYRIPPGTQFPGTIGPGIDVIQTHHRYAVVAPSIHPNGDTYQWINEATGQTTDIPRPEDLPELPTKWVTHFAQTPKTTTTPTHTKANTPHPAQIIDGYPTGTPCHHTSDPHTQWTQALLTAHGTAHDAMTSLVYHLTLQGRQGCPGAAQALATVREAFMRETNSRRTPEEAAQEWARSLEGAALKAMTTPQGTDCPDDPTSLIPTPTPTTTPTPITAPKTKRHPRSITLTPAEGYTIRKPKWFWQDRVLNGSIGLLAGPGGCGKSTISYWLAAQISQGTLPGEHHGTPKDVIISATEDSWEHIIVPRLVAAGADLTRVYNLGVTTSEGHHVEADLPVDLIRLEAAFAELTPGLLILDPIMSRLSSKINTDKDAEVRLALEPLTRLAERVGIAVLGIIHFNKGSNTGDVIDSIMASRAFTAVARSVCVVTKDPDDETGTRRLLGTPKNNSGRDDLPLLAYKLEGVTLHTGTSEGDVQTSRVEWLGEHAGSIHEAHRASKSQTSEDSSLLQDATEWLEDLILREGDMLPCARINQLGHKEGHSPSTLKRARTKLGYISARTNTTPSKSMWMTPEYAERHGYEKAGKRGYRKAEEATPETVSDGTVIRLRPTGSRNHPSTQG